MTLVIEAYIDVYWVGDIIPDKEWRQWALPFSGEDMIHGTRK